MFSYIVLNDLKIKNKTTRGIQGYYWNTSKNKYVWLRSSWEYIYAKWLNEHKIEWDVEVKRYKLGNTSYLPDFFIYENGKLTKIVEIKGYWKNKLYKYDKLKTLLGDSIELVLVTDIKPYTNLPLKKEIETWRLLRKRELRKYELSKTKTFMI